MDPVVIHLYSEGFDIVSSEYYLISSGVCYFLPLNPKSVIGTLNSNNTITYIKNLKLFIVA